MPIILPPIEYIISSGQTSNLLTEDIRHNELVLSGGRAEANQVSAGGHVYISSGGLTFYDTVFSGGVEIVSAGGSSYSTTVSAGGVLEGAGDVYGGFVYGLLSGVTVGSGSPLYGGPDFHTDIESGGSASAVTVIDGVLLKVSAGGVANSTTVLDGALDLVSSAQEAFARVSGAGAILAVGSACSAYADIIIGGEMSVDGEADFAYVASGGVINVGSGLASSTEIAGGGRLNNVHVVSDTQIDAGGVLSDGIANLSEGADFDTVVSSGGILYTDGVSTRADIQSGGVLACGQLSETVGGGTADFQGVIISAHFEAGALLAISEPVSTYVYPPSFETDFIQSSTFDSGSVVSMASVDFRSDYTDFGTLTGPVDLLPTNTFSGATLEIGQATVETYVTLVLAAGATVGSVTVSSGGEAALSETAIAGGATILAGGLLFGGDIEGAMNVYGAVSSAALGADGGALIAVQSGGVADAVDMIGAGDSMAVLSGGLAVSAEVGARDTLTVASGGVISGTDIFAGTTNDTRAYVYGSAINTNVGWVSGGGDLVVWGTAVGVQVGYHATFEDDGAASGVHVSSGGTFILDSRSPVANITVAAGGVVDIVSGSIVYTSGRQVLAGKLVGGGLVVEQGAGALVISARATTFTGQAVISGGVIELAAAGGLGSGSVDFADNTLRKTLKIDAADRPANGGAFGATVYDFDSSSATYIDLAGEAFATGATATLSGHTLTLHDGAYAAAFTLGGTAASRYAVFSDGAGGTEIRAMVGSTRTPLLAHAMAAFSTGHGVAAGTIGRRAPGDDPVSQWLKPH
jgi:autotransporter passenger strand-loop-strand repeat protein/autotransporter-associated beta strand protein